MPEVEPLQYFLHAAPLGFAKGGYRKLEDLLPVISNSRLKLELNLTNFIRKNKTLGKTLLLQVR